jgi:steroid 5-alpha reductase family enzyme
MRKATTQAVLSLPLILLIGGAIGWAGSQGGLRVGGVPVFALCGAICFALNWLVFVPSYAAQTERYFDLTGSLTYLTVVAFGVALGGRDPRALLLALLVGVWALRLAAFWIAGFTIEALADHQKGVFRADPANRDRFITSGLWAWSRHPNYCGEILLWIGVALIALPALSGWPLLTLISPFFVYVLLTRISGIPLLESRSDAKWGDDPAYRAYKARTPVLWLRPPASR